MFLGYRLTIITSGVLHAAFYVGALLLDTTTLLAGSVISGLGIGVIWVVIPNYVTVISPHKDIERNLSCHMFLYNLNGIVGECG